LLFAWALTHCFWFVCWWSDLQAMENCPRSNDVQWYARALLKAWGN
jgi:hypothetical protein